MVFGNLSTGYWLGVAAAAGLHWVELGRTTLSGAVETINVSSLTAKPYMMVLAHTISTGSSNWIQPGYRFNGDTGTNYNERTSRDNATDSTQVNRTSSIMGVTAHDETEFSEFSFFNSANQEKITHGHSVMQNTAGAGTAPRRRENVGKWANTSDQVTQVGVYNGNTGANFATGSEVVVLGYDPDDTTGTSVWEELASVELGSSGDSLDTGTFTAKKYLWVQIKRNRTGSVNSRIRVNGDSGSNYAHRYSGGANSYSESTSTTQTSIYSHAATSNESLTNYFIINKTDEEKLMIIEEVNGAAAGAGNAPERAEVVAKWTNTSAQITSIQCINTDSGDLTSGTSIKVWGFD